MMQVVESDMQKIFQKYRKKMTDKIGGEWGDKSACPPILLLVKGQIWKTFHNTLYHQTTTFSYIETYFIFSTFVNKFSCSIGFFYLRELLY